MLRFLRWGIGPQEAQLKDSITEEKALLYIQELFCNHRTLAGMLCALNVPLVSALEYNLQISKDELHKGRMHCKGRWRIQETVQSHSHFMCPYITLPLLEMVEEDDLEE